VSPMRAALLCLLALCQGCAASSLIVYAISPDHPDDAATETLQLNGLTGPVTVTFDAWGVPHIEAMNLVDLGRANGYVQGRSRFFQMDMMRRLAKGKVSELVGEQPLLSETTVDYDRTMRGWLIEERARVDLSKMSPEQAQILKAFAEGVNAAVQRHLPLEYRLLGVDPMPWEPSDSLAVGLLNVWSVSHNWTQESTRLLLAMSVGLERAERISPNDPARGGRTLHGAPTIRPLPPAVAPEFEGMFPWKSTAPAAPAAEKLTGLGVDPIAMMGASNAWVVDGKRSVSGKPMVANDPHLTHLLPSILVQLHLKAPDLDVIGVTVPGIPYILAGHNGRVAWGITSTVADVIDLLIEKVDPAHPGQVVTDAETPCPISTRDELINVRDGSQMKPQLIKMRRTCHGPVFNDIHPRLFPAGSPLISIRWRTDGMERSMDVLLAMNRAQTTQEMGAVIANLPATYNTWTVGDVDGHIGAFLSGEVPVHEALSGTFPAPGWLTKYDWTTWAKGEQLPWSMDPEEGFLAHANNLMADPGAEPWVTPSTPRPATGSSESSSCCARRRSTICRPSARCRATSSRCAPSTCSPACSRISATAAASRSPRCRRWGCSRSGTGRPPAISPKRRSSSPPTAPRFRTRCATS
jgi:penicillin amidase